jgi:hypothetical protein
MAFEKWNEAAVAKMPHIRSVTTNNNGTEPIIRAIICK